MPHLSVRTLGPLQVHLGGEPATGFDSDKVRALLVYLAIETDHPHRREKLAGLLWPDYPDSSARTSLRSALANLRKVIGDQDAEPGFLMVSRQTIQFNRQSDYEIDAQKFSQLADMGSDHALDTVQLEKAVSLYSGDFLEGFSLPDSVLFEDWSLVTREALRRRALYALNHLTEYYREQGNYEKALELAMRQIDMEPFQEAAHQQAMWIWALSGRRNESLSHYENLRKKLETELGVAPLKQTQEMFQQLQEGELPSPPTEVYLLRREPKKVGKSPYRGLAAFREQDAPFYHGRERFVEQLMDALRRRSLVGLILGSSGTGKSSVVFAGMIPRLRENGEWLIVDFRPGGQPYQSIASALMTMLEPEISEADRLIESQKLADAIKSGELPLTNAFERVLKKYARARRLLLVADQFEEIYTLFPEPDLRNQFINNLLEAVNPEESQKDSPIVLLLTLRADFMGQVLGHRPLADALQDGTFIMGPMNREELRRAIQNPAEEQGAAFEAGLVNRLLDDVGEESGNLPLLEFALTLMWELLDEGWFTHAAYEEIGRVEGALARYAEKVFTGLNVGEQENAKRVFIQLVQPGQGTEDTRRIATRKEVGGGNWSFIQKLADRRLLVTGRNEEGMETVELVHEAMIRGWDRLRGWMDADRSFRVWQEGLRAAMRGWEVSDRDEGGLLRGAPLAQANAWFEERRTDLSELEIDYIRTSLDRQAAEQVRREKRRRRTIIVLATGLVLAIFLVVIAGGQWFRAENASALAFERQITAQANAERAENERRIAFARELAAAANTNLDLDPDLSVLLALSAVSEPLSAGLPIPREAEEALHAALLGSRLRWTLPGGFGADFSPDGTLLAVSGPNSTAIIWDVSSHREVLTLAGHSGDEYGVSIHFSPDGERLATSSADGSAKVWDISSGTELVTLVGHTDTIRDCVFNSDGSLLATVSDDGTVRVWNSFTGKALLTLDSPAASFVTFDPKNSRIAIAIADDNNGWAEIRDLETGDLLLTLIGHEDDVNDVAFNEEGTKLATASDDGTIKVWDALSGEEITSLSNDTALYSLEFSSDGRFIAAGTQDSRVKVWNSETGVLIYTISGHNNAIFEVDFSPDNKQLVTASLDGTTKVWDISPGGNRDWLTLAGHNHVVFGVDYSPDGEQIATSSWDGTAIVWDANTGEKLLVLDDFSARVSRIIYSPSGESLATADFDGMVKIWEVKSGEMIYAIQAHSPGDIDIAFSPDGKYLASCGSDGEAKLWEFATGDEVRSFIGHSDVVTRLTFSPDGNRLATASWDDTTRLWDVATGEQILEIMVNTLDVNSVDFSPSGGLLATTYEDGTTRVWDISGSDAELGAGSELLSLVGHSNTVWDAAFSPDGKLIATLSFDGTARIWNAQTGEELIVLPGSNNGPDLDFSPDGKFLVTTSGDGNARVFILPIEDLVALAHQRVSRSLMLEECRKYLHLEQCPASLENTP